MYRSSTLRSAVGGALFSLALFAGCATAPQVKTNADTAANFSEYHTFSMLRPSPFSSPHAPEITPALVREVRNEAERAFVAQGLVKVPQLEADLLILVHGGITDKYESGDHGLAYGPLRVGVGSGIERSREGSLLIDVFDARTRDLVWRGTTTAQIDGLPEPEQVKAVIHSIVARYPN